ncbi:MAG TPA: VCBS repeat-containing protein [Acidimicrobiales bacterium]|jgi:hypothetical protein|nr:VCBS repeat-containing protein [Acidimicrobiales bacterium]
MTIDGSSAPWRRIVGASAVGLVGLAACNLGANPVTYTLVDTDQANFPLEPRGVASGDVDGDGDVDLVAAGRNGYGVLSNDGTGALTADVTTVAPPDGASPALADVDGDDDLDLLTASPSLVDQTLDVPVLRRNDGDGHFGAAALVAPGSPAGDMSGLDVSDVDGDGDVDIVAPFDIGGTRYVGVFANDGSGTFTAPVTYSLAFTTDQSGPSFLAVGDLDEDGDDDLVVTYWGEVDTPSSPPEGTRAAIALNDGDGAFTAVGDVEVGARGTVSRALPPALGDLDGDGHLDIAVGGQRSVTTLLGDGAGGFGPAQWSFVADIGSAVDVVTTADVDGDGNLDIVGGFSDDQGAVVYGDGAGGVDDVHVVGSGTESTLVIDVDAPDLDADGDADLVFLGGNTVGVVENAVDGRPNH